MILHILLLMFIVTDAYIFNSTIHKCVNYGQKCDPFLYVPCCNSDNECRRMGWGAIRNTYTCIKSLKYSRRCNYNLDCLNVDYTECFDGNCKCLPNYVEVSQTQTSFTCAALLGEFCEKNETCMVHNSVCIDHKCRCKSTFVSKTNQECVPTSLRKDCANDFDCNAAKNSKCSVCHKCICKDNYAERNNATCKPLLGEFCNEDYDCAVDKAICKNSKCQCKNEFISKSNDKCIPSPLGKYCRNNDDCSGILHNKCSKNKVCVCRDNYDEINNSTCEPILGEFCWKNERCAATNSICYNNECQCKSDYVPLSKNECIKSPVGSACSYDSDCDNILQQTKCSEDKKCVCKDEFVSLDGVSCLQILGDYCYNDDQCGPKFSICRNHKCQCQHPFKAKSIFKCMILSS